MRWGHTVVEGGGFHMEPLHPAPDTSPSLSLPLLLLSPSFLFLLFFCKKKLYCSHLVRGRGRGSGQGEALGWEVTRPSLPSVVLRVHLTTWLGGWSQQAAVVGLRGRM